MKNITLYIIGIIAVVSCSSTSTKAKNDFPMPPINLKQSESNGISPKLNKNTSASLKKFESQNNSYVPFSKTQEIRGYGGTITEIRVNNRGDLPNYYIYPNQQPDLNINNQQRNISAPTWQLNW